MKMPVVFVSHGAPDIALSTSATTQCWQALGKQLPTPKAILALSAHWTTQQPIISNASQPETIYDFGGFPNALYQLTYPAQALSLHKTFRLYCKHRVLMRNWKHGV